MRILLTTTAMLLALAASSAGADDTGQIAGIVSTAHGDPLAGATVTLRHGSDVLAQASTDERGAYLLRLPEAVPDPLEVAVSCIGFASERNRVPVEGGEAVLDFTMTSTMVDASPLTVSARPFTDPAEIPSRRELRRRSNYSPVPTNPTSAIRQPEVAREGSQHSSKIRVHGTAPNYHLNGFNVGADPNHYGAFSIIPASAVDRLEFQAMGTGAEYGLPATVAMHTPLRFNQSPTGEFNLSLIEATGTLAMGTEQFFTQGSLRKSTLDKLVERFDLHSERRTLPPTNFQDVFISSGALLNDHHLLLVDQYYVQDFLSYDAADVAVGSDDLRVFQHTKEQFFGLRWLAASGLVQWTVRASSRGSDETYRAYPSSLAAASEESFAVDVNESLREYRLGAEATIEFDSDARLKALTGGLSAQVVAARELDMYQSNWNFLPPDAASDQPYAYQDELNQLYGEVHQSGQETNTAAFVSIESKIVGAEAETGLRWDNFSDLGESGRLSLRQRLAWRLSNRDRVEVFAGSFAENPRSRVLQAYQVLVREFSTGLNPIRTYLLSAGYTHGPVSLSVFGKRLDDLPCLEPDFSYVTTEGVEEGFLAMRSSSSAGYVGGDITVRVDSLMDGRLDLYGFYGYTHARSVLDGVTTTPDNSAPHRLYLQAGYKLARWFTLGADWAMRSGYAYTPTRTLTTADAERYSQGYYQTSLLDQNSARFPSSLSFDLHGEIDFGRTQLYLNVSNVTNHSNPIINTSDGFVYDAGILPTIGLRHSF